MSAGRVDETRNQRQVSTASDPFTVTIPNVMARVADLMRSDPGFPGRNAAKLAQLIDEYEAEIDDQPPATGPGNSTKESK